MQKFIFSVLLFLLLITTATADTTNDYFNFSGSRTTEYEVPDAGAQDNDWDFDSVYFPEISNMKDFKHLQLEMVASKFSGTKNSDYDTSVIFTIDGNTVGTGIFGYHRTADDGTVYIHVFTWPSTWDVEGLSGAKRMMITANSINVRHSVAGWSQMTNTMPTNGLQGHLMYENGWVQRDHDADGYEYNLQSEYEQSYPFDYTDEQVFNSMNIVRSSVLKAKVKIEIGGEVVQEDTSFQSTSLDWMSNDKTNNSWEVSLTNEYDDVITKTIVFGDVTAPTGTVVFNQSHYTDPDGIGVEYTISNMDVNRYEYWIEVMGTNNAYDTWLGVNEEYLELSGSSGQSDFTLNQQWLTLPMDIKACLYMYDKVTGTTSTIAVSEITSYGPASIAPGCIWTDKAQYNTSEVVTVWTDTLDGGHVRLEKRLDNIYDSFTVYDGLDHVKFPVQTADVGQWDVYLFEDSELTNQTTFEVMADNETAHFKWDVITVHQGEAARYNYVATSSNSVITIYDGTDRQLYQFNASTGYNTGQIATQTGLPGNWTAALYDNGTYYNASLEVLGSYSWVRFDCDDYYIGDTIKIEYFITSENYKISLKDDRRKTVLCWLPGTFQTGQRGTLEYTLGDNNEFGHNVEIRLKNGYYRPGEWEIIISSMLYEPVGSGSYEADNANVHVGDIGDQIGGTGGEGSIITELTAIAELAGFRGEVGLFILSILIIIIASGAMLISRFPVQGMACIDILLFFAFIGIGFIPILYLILFGVVAGLIVFGTIFFRKAG